MRHYLPTELYIENDCVKKNGGLLKNLGSRAFIMTGHSSAVNGSLDDLTEKLDELGITYKIFNETGENPLVATVMKAGAEAAAFGADFVVGLGGGSPLDAAKAVALVAANPKKGSEILYEKAEFPHLPVVGIPTTAGTGSEVTQYSILTLPEQRTKKGIPHMIFPVYAFNDPKYLKTLSHNKLIDTSVDTLAHLVESYLSAKAENSVFCEKGLALWGSLKQKIKNNSLDDADRERLMLTSALGGMTIAQTSTTLPHGLSYKVTYELNIPHGRACGIFLGGYVENYPNKEKTKTVLSLLGFDTAEDFKAYLIDLLDQKPLDAAFALENANSLIENTEKLKNHPYNVTPDELLRYENRRQE